MNQHPKICLLVGLAVVSLLVGGCAEDTTAARPATGNGVNQYVQGYQAYKRGETEVARRNLESAVLNNPDLRMARTILGEIYRSKNDYGAAARQYEVLTRIDPYTLSNHYFLGVSYQFLNRYRDSVAAYLKGLKLEPTDFKSNMNLGIVYLYLNETDTAIQYLDKATQIDPKSATAWSNLGVALDARGSLVLAETAYRKAIEQDTNSLPVLQNLANNLLAQKKVGEAVYLWEQIVGRNKTSFTQTKLAESYTAAGEFQSAAKQLDDVLSRDPRYVPAVNAKANMLIRQYELSGFTDDKLRVQAVDQLQRSLALNGNQTKVAELIKKWSKSSGFAP
jgi:superkiller protein 3